MKKNVFKKLAALIITISLLSLSNINASTIVVSPETKVNTILRLGILKGDTDGNLRLDDKIIRSEIITAFIRSTGLENSINDSEINVLFKDIDESHWAYKYIGTAIKNSLIAGYPDNTVGPDKNITYAEALTMILRILGYKNDSNPENWPPNVINKCYELGIIDNKSDLPDRQITRREVACLIYDSLSVDFNK